MEKLLRVSVKPAGFMKNLAADVHRLAIEMEATLQAIMQEDVVLPVGVPCPAAKEEGKADPCPKQRFAPDGRRNGAIPAVIIPANAVHRFVVKGCPGGIDLKVEQDDVRILISLKGV